MVDVVTGLATGCRYAGCALIGGETAEMPGMYAEGEYDLAGAIVGLADKDKIVDGSSITEGDVVIGLASSGLHTNGYSLARKVCFDLEGLRPDDAMPGTGKTVAEALMEPHRSYAKIVGVLTRSVPVHGMVHVTGGGVTDNLPRVLPGGLEAQIDLTAWRAPRIFQFLSAKGRVSQTEMLRTFNCGVGYIVIVPEGGLDKALHVLNQTGEKASVIGRIAEGEGGVRYQGELAYA
jgi:phosphoribosylformylglycinamidine cyclo-ligase